EGDLAARPAPVADPRDPAQFARLEARHPAGRRDAHPLPFLQFAIHRRALHQVSSSARYVSSSNGSPAAFAARPAARRRPRRAASRRAAGKPQTARNRPSAVSPDDDGPTVSPPARPSRAIQNNGATMSQKNRHSRASSARPRQIIQPIPAALLKAPY